MAAASVQEEAGPGLGIHWPRVEHAPELDSGCGADSDSDLKGLVPLAEFVVVKCWRRSVGVSEMARAHC